MKALLNLFVESAANDQATYSEWNNMSVVNRTATSEQSWRRKEPTPRRKQSTQAKQLTARSKNALARVTLQENKITPNRTLIQELKTKSSISYDWSQGRNQFFISGGTIFMNFHSMTSSCLFNRGTTFSQTLTYNNNVFLAADMKSILQTHTFCTTLVNKNRQNRTFYNSVGGWITGVKRNFWLAKVLTSHHMRMHRATFNIWNTLRKLMIRA